MPLGVKPICSKCKTLSSTMWRKGPQGQVLCNSCGLKHINGVSTEPDQKQENGNGNGNGNSQQHHHFTVLRKSSRIKPVKHRHGGTKNLATKGKSRRIIFKKNTIRGPDSVSTVVTCDWVFHKGIYYQIGDIVSLVDHDGGTYYAQIRGFMQDQFQDKSAVITWLIPTQASPPEMFDPLTYILGPEEDIPRKMDYMEFVCHAPSEYYKAKHGPYPTLSLKPDLCYVWTNIGPAIKTIPTVDEIFGPQKDDESDVKKFITPMKKKTEIS